MRLLAPAKINLHLHVGPRGSDGFHPLSSWMCTVGLFDTLEILPPARAVGNSIVTLNCDDASLPRDGRNLVVRAAEALAREFNDAGEVGKALPDARHAPVPRTISSMPRTDSPASGLPGTVANRGISPVTISLAKRIPSGGGLGGGSSDAAFTLLALSRFWNLNASKEQLYAIAASLGSDVPFFLSGRSSLCRGRGEIVTPIRPPKPRACLLILPPIASATHAVYRRFDEISGSAQAASSRAPVDTRSEEVASPQWAELSADELLPRLVNDLEPAAFDLHPEIGRLAYAARDLLHRPVRMSGSGSSLFTLFDDRMTADVAAASIRERLGVQAVSLELAPPAAEMSPNLSTENRNVEPDDSRNVIH